jgi:hypothetical protein
MVMRRGLLAILALALWPSWALAQGQAGAAPPQPARPESTERPAMRFEWVREGPASECRDRCRAWISAAGRITEATPADFEAFIQGLDLRGATVALESGGGLVEGGLALGRAFRRLGLATTVGRTVWLPTPANGEKRATLSPRAVCASMCAFAILGGVRRHVPDEARVLVHQIWPSKLREDAVAANYTAGNMVRIQRELGQIARYTIEMGADIDLFEIAMRIPPWENLRPLRVDELRRLRVHNSDSAFGGTTAESVAPPAPTRVARLGPAPLPAEGSRGWALATNGGRSALTRRHPLTIEGQDIGSFEISISCSDTPDMYQVAYREKRLIEAGTPADRVNGVRMMIRREPVRLKLESSAASSNELVSSARGLVSAPLAGALAEPGGGSLLVETLTANKQRTAIRIGPAGLADGFRDMAASCPK